MRKVIGTGVCVCVAALAVWSGSGLFADPDRAFVAFLSGTAQIGPGPAGPWKPLAAKDIVADSSYIQTGKDAKLLLRYKGVDVRLVGQSQIQIKSLSQPGSAAAFSLNRGFAWVHLKEKRELSVATPTAIASVRGTKFAMGADENGTISCVCEGRVATESLGDKKSRNMGPGGSHSFGADGKFKESSLKKYFRKLKVDVTFKREIRKEKKYGGCLSCHQMVDLKSDKSSDEFGAEYW